MLKKISNFNKYLLEKYDAIALSEVGIKEKPPYDQRIENVYLMEMFGFRPDNSLLDEMLKNPMLGQKIKEIMAQMPNATDRFDLAKECYPKGDKNFEKKFIKDIQLFNDTGKMSAHGMEALVNPMPYSYIDRTAKTSPITVATKEFFADIFNEFVAKEEFSLEDAEIFIGLEQSCNLMEIANELDKEKEFIEKITYANIVAEAEELKNKNTEKFEHLQQLFNQAAKTWNIESVLSETPVKTFDKLQGFYENVISKNEIEKEIEAYVQFRNNEYISIDKKNVSALEIQQRLETNANKQGIKTQYDFQKEEQIIKDLDSAFCKSLISLTESQHKAREENTNVLTPLGQKLFLENQKKIDAIHQELESTIKAYSEFRQKFGGFLDKTAISVQGIEIWLNLHMTHMMEGLDPVLTFEEYQAIEDNNDLDEYDDYGLDDYDYYDYKEDTICDEKINLEQNIIDMQIELDELLTLPPEKLFENIENITEKKQEFKDKINTYVNFINNDYRKCYNCDEIKEEVVQSWLTDIKNNQYEYNELKIPNDTRFCEQNLADNILDGDEKLEVPTTTIDENEHVK